jgi:hypothetical protein
MESFENKNGDFLITDNSIVPQVKTVTVTAALPKGTVLAKKGTSYVPLGTTVTDENEVTAVLPPNCILAENSILFGAETSVNAAAYSAGKFNSQKLTALEDYTITDDDITELRRLGIFIENTVI